jgi:hypothetical protein
MSQPPIEALPDDIARLLAREKDAYPIDPEVRRAVFSRVEMAIALGGGGLGGNGGPSSTSGTAGVGHAASVAKKGVAGKLIAVALAAFVGGGVTGGAVVKTMTHAPALAPVGAIPPATSSPAAPPAPVPVPLASATSPNAEAPSPPPRASVAPSSGGVPSSHGDIIREREILDAARAALAHGQARDAILAMQEHARRWPNGELTEEREVVLIQALVAAGRSPEARARAARFHQTFPKSIFAPAIDVAIGAAPASP